jgi:hypothetical protein
MDTFELLNSFAEGSLDDKSEKELLFELTGNDEMRLQLRQLLSMNAALNEKRKIFAVPPSSTNAIFSKLAIGGAAGGFFASVGSFFSRYANTISTSAAASFVTALVMYFIMSSTGEDVANSSGSENMSANSVPVESIQPLALKMEIPKVSSNAPLEKSSAKAAPINSEQIANAELVISDEKDNEKNHVPFAVNQFIDGAYDTGEKNDKFEKSLNNPANENYFVHVPNRSLTNFEQNLREESIELFPLKDESGPVLLIHNTRSWQLGDATVDVQNPGAFYNFGIMPAYKWGGHYTVGLDIRNESYFQVFHGDNEEGRKVSFEQQPTYWSFTPAFQYTFDDIGGISPYLRGAAGGNDVGYVFRLGTGGEYMIGGLIGLNVGVEFNRMGFVYQGNWFDSDKVDLILGIRF